MNQPLRQRARFPTMAFTIADISLIGWVRNLITFYDAGDLVDYAALKAVPAWVERCLARPAVARGLTIPARPDT